MSSSLRWTSADLESMPDDGKRYEIIDGELAVSKQPHYEHQVTCTLIATLLVNWDKKAKTGQALIAPGLIFAEDDDVAPDVIWISNGRLKNAIRDDGKLHLAPELVVEVLSPSTERRDREAKLKLYSRRGVQEYWIADWRTRQVEVYRRDQQALQLVATLFETDVLQSPLLEGFSCKIVELFENVSD